MSGSRIVGITLLAISLAASPVRAAVDLTGDWHLDFPGLFPGSATGAFTQDGTALALGVPTLGLELVGSIDLASLQLNLAGSHPTCSQGHALHATADPAGDLFEGTLTYQTGVSCQTVDVLVTGQRLTGPPPRCGDGTIDPDEECDDGNTTDFDCCSSTCQLDPPGSPCGLCERCDGAGACGPQPLDESACKRPVDAHAARLLIANADIDAKDRIRWRWSRGAATSPQDLGDPMSSDDYTLCVFDLSGPTPGLVVAARAPAGTGWRARRAGYRYHTATLMPDGIASITLKAGADRKAKAFVAGKGPLLVLPVTPAPFKLPLLVQLDGGGSCWEARFDAARVNDGITLKALD